MQLNTLLAEFLLELRIKNYSDKTVKGYKNNIGRLLEFIRIEYGVLEVEELTTPHIKAYVKYLKLKGRSPVYINTILKNIRSMFAYAVKEDYRMTNPTVKVSWLKEEKKVLVVPTDTEVAKMLSAYKGQNLLDVRNTAILSTFVDTGVRCSELINLRRSDIINGTMLIKGKGNKQRFVPLSPLLQKQLLKYENARNYHYRDVPLKADNFFLSSRGKALTVEALERVVKIAGYRAEADESVRCSPHTLRHYYAVKMLDNGVDMYSLARLMGHSTVRTTQRYVTATTDRQVLQRTLFNTPLSNL